MAIITTFMESAFINTTIITEFMLESGLVLAGPVLLALYHHDHVWNVTGFDDDHFPFPFPFPFPFSVFSSCPIITVHNISYILTSNYYYS